MYKYIAVPSVTATICQCTSTMCHKRSLACRLRQIYDPSWTEATAASKCSTTLNRDGSFERTVGHTYIQLDRLSGLEKFSLAGDHIINIHRHHWLWHAGDIISGLAGLIAKSPVISRDTDTA